MKAIADQARPQDGSQTVTLSRQLWLYTNFDCNLWCSYSVAESTPKTPRRALGVEVVQRLVDEAALLVLSGSSSPVASPSS
jgi:hypothetical protein